ncbi:MAG: hypothetical protein A3E31_11270 [Candidatus Rokubacteria bacterium RIFCSPHIGHO2_12_FULL_73_22]|nr:MAG: hypothetical protein A3E31_11270 [Candidatus Rokubacteria bacterium RIFCSPHIGHO2_12_FULL_73_22]OGL01856.1 MAG: hypothetical protein A3D33_12850 [Candidatus Rokubacteria bacterium RIFCSPHIGHO2_02_FULL_73_26]OGL08680.1 MAG: hypothetical protein A3I14_03055 [Candidatus Rokubacteria bacterium RIFCSPLOWO2_02_FULL_73_56]OGL25415.1 MAG: hypothetical protein A3G44_02000 [Candidatus Rokubacteria bacterium RIFCSPLOWO2_12_FULL_73_47]
MCARISRRTPARAATSPASSAVEWVPKRPRSRAGNVASWISVSAPRARRTTASQGAVSEE